MTNSLKGRIAKTDEDQGHRIVGLSEDSLGSNSLSDDVFLGFWVWMVGLERSGTAEEWDR